MKSSKSQNIILGIIAFSAFTGLVLWGISKNAATPKIKNAPQSSLYLYSVTGKNYQADIGDKNTPNLPKVKFASSQSAIEFSPDNINGSTVKQEKPDEKSVIYKNIWPGISVKYSTLAKGLKEEIVIESLAAWTSYSTAHQPNFEFTVKTDNTTLKSTEIDQIKYYYFVDPQTDKYRFKFEKPFMKDAGGKKSEAVTLKLKDESVLTNKNPSGDYLFLITPDQSWLEQAKYPLVIDPTASVSDLYNDTTKIDATNSSDYTVTGGQLKMDIKTPWYNTGGVYWNYQIPITYDNTGGGAKTNYDVLVVVDTQTPINAGKMQSDCDDLRFTDTDGTTLVNYWIESGCNTSSTQIWVRIPTIAASTSETYYMYYGNPAAAAGTQSWAGYAIVPFDLDSAPAGWSSATDYNGTTANTRRFPQAAASYGATGGSSTHSHTTSTSTATTGINASGTYAGTGTAFNMVNYHSHSLTANNTLDGTSLPDFYDLTFATYTDIANQMPATYPASSVLAFNVDSGSLPAGWSSFGNLNTGTRFPRGNGSARTSSTTTSHSHSANPTLSTVTANETAYQSSGTATQNVARSAGSHTHTATWTCSTAVSHVPPYYDVDFASNASDTSLPVNTIMMFTVLPTYGWTQFSSANGKYLRGNTTYGGTGGAATHSHTDCTFATAATGTASTYSIGTAGSGLYYGNNNGGHKHSMATGSFSAEDNAPPYVGTILATRNSTAVASTLGNEVTLVKTSYIRSINLLGAESQQNGVSSIDSFVYNLSDKPAGTTASAQFSQNGSTWYDSAGSLNAWDTLTTGVDNSIDLSALTWSGKNFYYKLLFGGDGSTTPVLDDIKLNYSYTIPPTNCTLNESGKNDYIIVNWTDNNDKESGYEINRAVGGTDDWFVNPIATTSASAVTYTDNTVLPKNIYRYRVRAKGGNDHSGWCYTATLNLGVGNFTLEGIKAEGVKIE